MTNPIIQSEKTDSKTKSQTQAEISDSAPGARIEAALQGRQQDWLATQTGIPNSTISSMKEAKSIRGDRAVLIARATGVELEWLLGYGPLHPIRKRSELSQDAPSGGLTGSSYEESFLVSMFSELSAREREAVMSMLMVLTGRTVDLEAYKRPAASSLNSPGSKNVSEPR
ncbi:helix-turn-helix domain-containing protein [Blastomonas fulva]|uniref:helix-turn-helix domain-containing protein n=1 Tax=Blastomonas fulva TaxID=1550728 RepID=UPI00403408AD